MMILEVFLLTLTVNMMQHQVVQSPARLGLTSSNPTPQPPPPKQPQAPNTIPPLLSPALVPLLPPLPRAQSLLHHLASIASALFHASPKHALWLSSLRGTLPTFLSTPAAPSPSTVEDLLSHAASLQADLSNAVSQLEPILDAHRTHLSLEHHIRQTHASALAFTNNLKQSERLLDTLLDDYSHYRLSPPPPKITLPHLLSYARRVSYTTFAPPEFGADLTPLRGALPPAPQEEHMRASGLYSVSARDLGLPPRRGEIGEEEALMEAPPLVIKEAGAVPAAPSGWRPGMPVEIPGDVRTVVLPPAGWRPGDPVSLPPQGEEVIVVGRREAEPIQVRHVQLDITLDQDDDSSDYSTDVGSSDEEDDD